MTISPSAPSVWLSEAQVRDLVLSARKVLASLTAVINGIDSQVAARRDTINKSLNDLDVKDRMRAVDASASSLKATLKQSTSLQRTQLLRELARKNDTAKGAIQFWDSAVALVLRETIASEKRRVIFQNLESAGAVELKAFASLAIAGKDLDMAAAVIGRLHQIVPASGRPVSPRHIANELVGDRQREMHMALAEVDALLQEGILVERMFAQDQSRSGSNGVASVALAMKKRRIAEVGGTRVEEDGNETE